MSSFCFSVLFLAGITFEICCILEAVKLSQGDLEDGSCKDLQNIGNTEYIMHHPKALSVLASLNVRYYGHIISIYCIYISEQKL
jgi:hypothetical protein